jgi:hypothetical protein
MKYLQKHYCFLIPVIFAAVFPAIMTKSNKRKLLKVFIVGHFYLLRLFKDEIIKT